MYLADSHARLYNYIAIHAPCHEVDQEAKKQLGCSARNSNLVTGAYGYTLGITSVLCSRYLI